MEQSAAALADGRVAAGLDESRQHDRRSDALGGRYRVAPSSPLHGRADAHQRCAAGFVRLNILNLDVRAEAVVVGAADIASPSGAQGPSRVLDRGL
jgi:hypothetical protein